MLKTIFKYFINIFYPLNCPICATRLNPLQENVLCKTCENELDLFPGAPCTICGRPDEKCYFAKAAALGAYAGVLERCICSVKYNRNICLAKNLGKIMTRYMSKILDGNQIDVIVPVPLQPGKLRERQFNQAYLLGKVIAEQFNIPINHKELRKVKNTPSQVGLSDYQRKRNVRGAFRVRNTQSFKRKSVMLVDDVFTTGSTVNECAKALKNAGAETVTVYTLAKTILN